MIVTTTEEHWSSVGSAGNLSGSIAPLIQSSKACTQCNQLVTAIELSSSSISNAFEALLQQRQLAEDLEWRQRRLEREDEWIRWGEERQRREEELHEMRWKESRQQEQLLMVFQMAITGMMTYWGAKKPPHDKDDK